MFSNNLLFPIYITCNFSSNTKIEYRIRIFFIERKYILSSEKKYIPGDFYCYVGSLIL